MGSFRSCSAASKSDTRARPSFSGRVICEHRTQEKRGREEERGGGGGLVRQLRDERAGRVVVDAGGNYMQERLLLLPLILRAERRRAVVVRWQKNCRSSSELAMGALQKSGKN